MRSILAFWVFGVLAFSSALAQPPDTLWTRTLTGAKESWGLATASDGNFWLAGFAQSSASRQSAVIFKLDPQGSVLDSFAISDTVSHAFYSVAATADGGCIATGTTVTRNGPRLLLAKLNSTGAAEWVFDYNQNGCQVGNSVQQIAGGAYVVAGRAGSANGLLPCLLKVSSGGALQWARTWGVPGSDRVSSLRQTTDGGYVLTGTAHSPMDSGSTVLVFRANATGDSLWRRTYNVGNDGAGNCVRQTSDGGFVICGWALPEGVSSNSVFVLKINSTGDLLWSHRYSSGTEAVSYGMEQTGDGGFILAGYTRSSDPSTSRGMLLKVNSAGDSMWTSMVSGLQDIGLRAVALTGNGNVVAAGYARISDTNTSAYMVRLATPSGVGGTILDEQGSPVEGVQVSALGLPYWGITDPQGNYALLLVPGTYDLATSGHCTGRDTVRNILVLPDSITGSDIPVGRTGGVVEQSSLNPIVYNRIPGFDTLRLRNRGAGTVDFSVECFPDRPPTAWLAAIPPSGSIAPGDSVGIPVRILADTTNDGIYDYYGHLVVHMNSCPDSLATVVVIVSVLKADPDIIHHPSTFSLSAFPNPFNPVTEIHFDLPKAEHVSVRIFDLLGREVVLLHEELTAAGSHSVIFDGSTFVSGIYFVRLQSPSFSATRKIVLLR